MKTLTIKDLARTEQLERTAMAAVRGGWKASSPSYKFGDFVYAPTTDSSIHANQDVKQLGNVLNATANDAAFIKCLHVNNTNKVDGHNTIEG